MAGDHYAGLSFEDLLDDSTTLTNQPTYNRVPSIQTFSLDSARVPLATSPALETLRNHNSMMNTFAALNYTQAEHEYDSLINGILSVSASSQSHEPQNSPHAVNTANEDEALLWDNPQIELDFLPTPDTTYIPHTINVADQDEPLLLGYPPTELASLATPESTHSHNNHNKVPKTGASRATCEGCRKLHVKCIPSPESNRCEKCTKKGRDCVFLPRAEYGSKTKTNN